MKLRSRQGGSRARSGLMFLAVPLMMLLAVPSALAQHMHGSGGGHWHGNGAGVRQFNRGPGNFAGVRQFNRGPANFAGVRQFNRGPGNFAGVRQFDRRPGVIAAFHHPGGAAWRGGHWSHGHHNGRFGWWWVAGGLWFWYPVPVYPYPAYEPAVAMASPAYLPPPAQSWYYCESAGAYYPYVSSCPEGWQEVPSTPQQTEPAPAQ